MSYKFHDYKELAKGDGFGYPVDVNYGTVYLGTLEAESDGFVIKQMDTPEGKRVVAKSSKNKFKTKDDAANTLHRVWKMERHGKESYNENLKTSALKRLVKEILKEMNNEDVEESTEPSIGGSYNDQQSSFNSYVKPERDALTDPALTGKEPFKK